MRTKLKHVWEPSGLLVNSTSKSVILSLKFMNFSHSRGKVDLVVSYYTIFFIQVVWSYWF